MAAGHRVLDPLDRLSEVMFGLIMTMTITGSISVASAGREEIAQILIGAIGSNAAWGLVDGVMYVLAPLLERGHNLRMLHAIREASDPAAARDWIRDALPPSAATVMTAEQLEQLRVALAGLNPPPRPRLSLNDLIGGGQVFLVVFSAALPVILPFVLLHDPKLAIRVSNGIAIGMPFLCGAAVGRYSGLRPGRTGLAMVVIGLALVAITVALGG